MIFLSELLNLRKKGSERLPFRKFRGIFMPKFMSAKFQPSAPLCGYNDCPQCGATYFQPKDFLKTRTPACIFSAQNLCPGCWSTYTYIPFQDDKTRTDLINPCPVVCHVPWHHLFQQCQPRSQNALNIWPDPNNN